MAKHRPRALVAALLALAVGSALAGWGCGGGSGDGTSAEDPVASGAQQALGALTPWRLFGRTRSRIHYLRAPERLNPPLKHLWSFNDRVLIEFPPAVAGGVAYVADKYGNVRALRLSDRRVLWDIQRSHREVGPPSDVTAPVYLRGRLFVAFRGGELVAFDARDGKIIWKRNLDTHLESSPIVVGETLYLGSDKTNLFAINTANGRNRWQYNAASPIKSSPSYRLGRIYFGDYTGTMFCLDADSGKLIWQTDTTKVPPFGSGGFYSSSALAYGRVYAGRDDGTVYGFDARTGKKAWSYETGDDIYGSPALARVPGTPPTVYIGSYDHRLYALNALTGDKEWSFDVGGQVPGTATVIGHTVYTSSFQTEESIGIDVLTHRKTFHYPSPGYTPMISDGRKLFLIGYFSLHGFEPK